MKDMDIFAHTLWANVAARGVNAIVDRKADPTSQKLRGAGSFHINPAWAAFFGVVPDLFAFTAPFILAIYQVVFLGSSFGGLSDHHREIAGFDLASYLYQFSHSLVIFALVFILVWVLSKRPRYELLGWALHILIDIPSHTLAFYATPFLFPISDYRFPYGIQWSNQWFMLVNYTLLLVVWGRIIYKKYSNSATLS